MSGKKVIKIDVLNVEPNETEYRKEVETYLQSNIESKIDFWLIVGAFRTSKWWIISAILIYLVANVVCNFCTSFFGKNTMCTWLNITIFLFQSESLTLYVCAYLCVTDKFLKEVVKALTKIITESKEYKDIMNKISNNARVSRTSISMLNDNQINSKHMGYLGKFKSCIESCCFCFCGRDIIDVKDDDDRHQALIDNNINRYVSLGSNPINKAQNACDKVTESMDNHGMRMLKQEMKLSLFIILGSYLSGFIIFFTFKSDEDTLLWHVYVTISNSLDLLRYLPQMFHICLARAFYRTFEIRIDNLRRKYNIKSRKEYPYNNSNEFESNDITVNIDSNEFIYDLESICRSYRIVSSSKELIAWIFIFLICNSLAFIFYLISVVSAFASTYANPEYIHGDCDNTNNWYYAHYLAELFTFFISWIFLVLPFAMNNVIINELCHDIMHSIHDNNNEKYSLSMYLNALKKSSPFNVYGFELSYAKIITILSTVILTIGVDVYNTLRET